MWQPGSKLSVAALGSGCRHQTLSQTELVPPAVAGPDGITVSSAGCRTAELGGSCVGGSDGARSDAGVTTGCGSDMAAGVSLPRATSAPTSGTSSARARVLSRTTSTIWRTTLIRGADASKAEHRAAPAGLSNFGGPGAGPSAAVGVSALPSTKAKSSSSCGVVACVAVEGWASRPSGGPSRFDKLQVFELLFGSGTTEVCDGETSHPRQAETKAGPSQRRRGDGSCKADTVPTGIVSPLAPTPAPSPVSLLLLTLWLPARDERHRAGGGIMASEESPSPAAADGDAASRAAEAAAAAAMESASAQLVDQSVSGGR